MFFTVQSSVIVRNKLKQKLVKTLGKRPTWFCVKVANPGQVPCQTNRMLLNSLVANYGV